MSVIETWFGRPIGHYGRRTTPDKTLRFKMKEIALNDLEFLEIGNSIVQWGCVYSDGNKVYVVPFPEEDPGDATSLPLEMLVMTPTEWERFLTQTDVLDVQGPAKAILRKSQRQIDAVMSWRVFERDEYKCRYCGQKKPLTIDHLDLWEDGGATTDENLVAACKKCNKTRGRIKYKEWIESAAYAKISQAISDDVRIKNIALIQRIPYLETLRVNKVRSR